MIDLSLEDTIHKFIFIKNLKILIQYNKLYLAAT